MSAAEMQPQSMVVRMQTGEQIHYLEWDSGQPGVPMVLIHGLARTAWTWLPVARRLADSRPVVALDLRGHGASDAPLAGYDLESLAPDALTVVAGKGWGEAVDGPPAVVAGHGLGAMVAAEMSVTQPASIAALALVDGGWEEMAEATRMSPPELLAAMEDPDEVMASMDAYLGDRRDFDPASWDADQEIAARAQVNEKHAGHVRLAVKASVLRRVVDAMYAYRPIETLGRVPCRMLALVASSGAADDDEERERDLALGDVARARSEAELPEMRVQRFVGVGHDLMRYRPDAVAQALTELAEA
ncbi:MAG: alpha/beta fold hydrolase [Chloroflexota bacterium]